ncbi:MAG: hypothetical protein AB8B80_02785 [Marinicellaceae bacterium]
MKNYKLIIVTIWLLSCNHKAIKSQKLVTWENDFILFNEIKRIDSNIKKMLSGKDPLKIILLKKAFRKINIEIAKKNKLHKDPLFKYEYNQRKIEFLSSYYQKYLASNININKEEIVNYYNNNLEEFKSDDLYSLYITTEECHKKSECIFNLNEKLKNNSFQQISLMNNNKISGYFENIALKKLNKKIREHVSSIEVNVISKPIHFPINNNQKLHLFVLVDKFNIGKEISFNGSKKNIKQKLLKIAQEKVLNQTIANIIKNNPDYKEKSIDELLTLQFVALGLDNNKKVKNKLADIYDTSLANFGFYSSKYFDSIDVEKLRNNYKLMPNAYDQLSRYDFKIIQLDLFNSNKSDMVLINDLIFNNQEQDLSNFIDFYSQITKGQFYKKFKQLRINPLTLKYNKWVGPIFVDNRVHWLKKTYQGLAVKDEDFVKDYKQYVRYQVGSIEGFMDIIGEDIKLQVNPIIYSKNWPSIADELLKR